MDLVAAIILLFLMGYIFYNYYKRYQIEKYSSRYLELEHVTQRYLDSVREHPLIMNNRYAFDTKEKFDNRNNQERLFDEFLYKNKDELDDIVESVGYNFGLADYYEKELKEILSVIPPHPKYEKMESKLIKSYYEKIDFTKPFTFHFRFSYTSPKGQNRYTNTIDLSAADVTERLRQIDEEHVEKTEYEIFRDAERSKMTAGLRYDILKRDQFMCQFCGADANTHGVTLHVDHIQPVANWGKTEEDNLQTLCRDCNLGKGTKE